MTIAEQLIRAKTDLDEVYNAGYEAGKAEGGGEPTKVTDLTGTVWKLSNNIGTGLLNYSRYYIDFISNGTTYDSIKLSVSTSSFPPTVTLQYLVDNTATTVCTKKKSATWTHYNYRIIEISGGKDVTNTALIEQLYKDGELLSKGSYDDGFANGQNSILSEFADWSLSTTSNSCTVSITNTHTSLYLHLDFQVTEFVSADDTYWASVVVPPNSSYSWDNSDWYDGLSGAEWEIYITSMRFSKNGV